MHVSAWSWSERTELFWADAERADAAQQSWLLSLSGVLGTALLLCWQNVAVFGNLPKKSGPALRVTMATRYLLICIS